MTRGEDHHLLHSSGVQASSSGVTLRACARADLERVLRIENDSFSDPYSATVFDWFLSASGRGFVVACRGDEVIGYVIALAHGEVGHIASVAVSPACRRMGVGALLMREAVGYLARRNVRRVRLEVRAGNLAAIGLYRRLSFARTGVRRGYYPDGEDAIVMARELGAAKG